MAFKLRNLILDRVDLCGQGANPAADIMLFKSTKEDDVPAPKKKGVKAPAKKADTRSKSKQRGDEEEEEEEEDDAAVEKDDDEDDDAVDDSDDEADGDEADGDEEDEAPRKKSSKKPAKKSKKPTKKAAKSRVDDDDEGDIDDDDDDIADDDSEEEFDDGIPDDVLKTMPKSVQAAIQRNREVAEKAQKSAAEAHKLILAEKTRRETIEFVQKAKELIPNLPGEQQEKGAVLQAIQSLDKAIRKTLMKMLKSGDTAIKSMLMTEHGSRKARTDDDSAFAQLVEIRDELMEKNDKLTKEQAMTKACSANPDLYRKYRLEKKRQVVDDADDE